MLTLLYT